MLGKWLIYIGIFFVFLGFLIVVFERFLPIGRLPGDILIKRDNFTIYIPIATSILLSLLLTLLLNLIFRK